MGRFVAFGEIMLRLSPPGRELLLQTNSLQTWTAGAEANVATALALLGHDAAMVSAVPADALGDAAIRTLRGHGVDTRGIQRRDGRMALYFVTGGAGARSSEVIYDRSHSAFVTAPPRSWHWQRLLQGADRLHLSGITPALGPAGRKAAAAAAAAATRYEVPISFDGNYRARLWDKWNGQPRETLSALVAQADILFGNHRDIALMLGTDFGSAGDFERVAADAAFAAFPKLQLIASTRRRPIDADQHLLSARLDLRDRAIRTEDVRIAGIVDRIGAGDAFAAGVLHALRRGRDPDEAARTGLALTTLKHSLPGDAALFQERDLDAFFAGGFDVRR